MEELKQGGMMTADVRLRGRFHWDHHERALRSLIHFCDSHTTFQFPHVPELVPRIRSNSGGYIKSEKLHHVALQSILVEQCGWYEIFKSVDSSILNDKEGRVFLFGSEPCIPPTLMRSMQARLINAADLSAASFPIPATLSSSQDAIAVVGMSCKVAGADDLDEFWSLLQEGKSQHVEVPGDRIRFGTLWREQEARKWYGNFIRDPDSFDHRFFKKSPREMMSTDPQQRWMLQIAYQAVQQSGYFQSTASKKHVGCYIGVGCVDYEQNIACQPANAFSATGNLKSFVAGKISHWFGWTGPSMTVDTACSASAVAIHQACKAILHGDCDAALAGGATIMTSPLWFQNLAGGGFLSPTGSCKPFDANADGYCRGEGIGAVFLKRLSTAIEDGDQILGVIPSTAVFQNQNCTPITVPNPESLSELFRHVTLKAGLDPKQISVVEAHGTGTPVGDPAEYESVRRVFGGFARSDSVSVGSVKGLVGHTETASGIVSLIKVLLMINEGAIPPQASFNTINPSIKTSQDDRLEISKTLKPWKSDFRAALINNYGASGSNASMVVTQAPAQPQRSRDRGIQAPKGKLPFGICAYDEQSLREYVSRLRKFLRHRLSSKDDVPFPDLSFNAYRQSNRTLKQALFFSSSSLAETEEKLATFESGDSRLASTTCSPSDSMPVVLCFGGQVSSFVGLDRGVYANTRILRTHLDNCDSVGKSLGLQSIYPEIFSRAPIADTVLLQTMLFAVQYSCAKAWIDCGVQPAVLVGHSFGELTALCVSGTLSLQEAIKMVAGRAKIIRDSWGPEKGAMMAVEADLELVNELLRESNALYGEAVSANIACFNGPRSFTLAGPSKSIDAVAEVLSKSSRFSTIKSKRLSVTNAFHSGLVEPLLGQLDQVGGSVTFGEPVIPLERATEYESSAHALDSHFVAQHLRNSVFFNQAVQRISRKYPSAVWLEAGSNSSITNMACRALGMPSGSHFQPINITSDKALDHLTEATLSLWKQGLPVTFWQHHRSQTNDYRPLLLPPYQFAKTRHWVELKEPVRGSDKEGAEESSKDGPPPGLWTFFEYQDPSKNKARFRINTTTQEYEEYVKGHTIANAAPLCPSTLQLDIVIDALMGIRPDYVAGSCQPQLMDLENHAPMCLDTSKVVWLDVEMNNTTEQIWNFKMVSNSQESNSTTTLHVSGRVLFRSIDDAQFHRDFERYEYLSDYRKCLQLLDGNDAPEVIQGRNIYRTFASTVDYAEPYRGLQKIVGVDHQSTGQSAGRVVKSYRGKTWLDTLLADSFCQVAGIFVNCMTDTPESDICISTKIEQWIRSPKLRPGDSRPEVWDVLALHRRPSDREFVSDVFIFDHRNGALLEVILGIGYQRVSRAGLGKMLIRLTTGANVESTKATMSASSSSSTPAANGVQTIEEKQESSQSTRTDIENSVRTLLASVSGLEPHEIKTDTSLPDIGIDSLVGMELTREIEVMFKCKFDTAAMMDVVDFQSLTKVIRAVLGEEESSSDSEDENKSSASSNGSPANGSMTPVTDEEMLESSSVPSKKFSDQQALLTPEETAELSPTAVLEAIAESKAATDDFIADNHFGGYAENVLPRQTELCVAYVIDAFEKLGCSLRCAQPGSVLPPVRHLPKHMKFVNYCQEKLLHKEAHLIDIQGSRIIRTAVPLPTESADDIFRDLIENFPDHANDHRLVHYIGTKLAECLSGETDGVQLIFGSLEGRELVSGLYGRSPINMTFLKQMEDLIQRLLFKLPKQGPIKILEMGAGTGGTTAGMAMLLDKLNIPVEYTFTDLSPSLVAAARKRFKHHGFMKFRTHDIEKAPASDLFQSQHIVIANNCVHATRSLPNSTRNIREVLRPDGFLMMVEMTDTLFWVDLVFGILEGWWLFEDDRDHVVAPESLWKRSLLAAGYGHVDWTEGRRPEANLQRIIIALASEPNVGLPQQPTQKQMTDLEVRRAAVDEYVRTYSRGLDSPIEVTGAVGRPETCVLVTGATGSLGSHMVAHFAQLPTVATVICLNRRSSIHPAFLRQQQAMESRGISLDKAAWSKLKVFETDTASPSLGLPDSEYQEVVRSVIHIVHNAWPMSINRATKSFEPQFKVMRNLIQLSREASASRPVGYKVGFQFISSIATVGQYPVWTGRARVPEERMTIESVLPSGYGDAKLVCERMLDETLHKIDESFHPMVVRIGQIAGSKTSGYWNPIEHLAFLLKSSQALNALPQFEGVSFLTLPPIPQLYPGVHQLPFLLRAANVNNRNSPGVPSMMSPLPSPISSLQKQRNQSTISRIQHGSHGKK